MKKLIPAEEINIQELKNCSKRSYEKLQKRIEQEREEDIKEKRETVYLCKLLDLAENTDCNDKYSPYLLDFKTVLYKINDDIESDRNNKSLKIRIDISKQLLKMKKIPSLDTECHIESKDVKKSTNLINFIIKKFFIRGKYRLVFHGKKATFSKEFYKSHLRADILILKILTLFLFVISLPINNYFLFMLSLILVIILLIIEA